MAGYIGSKAVITSGISASIDELNLIDGVTATTAELNILDGVTSTAAELNILDGVTSTAAELNILDGVTSTAAELNILDGVTATAAELNLIDGGTGRGTTAVADGDGFLTNDGGTMRMTKVDTLATYMGTKIGGGGTEFIVSSGAISNAAAASFTGFDSSKYDSYEFKLIDLLPATDGAFLVCRTSSDTSNHSYDDGDDTYRLQVSGVGTSNLIRLNAQNAIGNAANEGIVGTVRVMNPHTSTFTKIKMGHGIWVAQNGAYNALGQSIGGGARLENAQVNAIQFFWSSGNIASGEIIMYGLVNA